MIKGYSPAALAETGVSGGRTNIYKLINAGLLRARKNGKRTVILDEDVRACVAQLPQIAPKLPQADATSAKPDANTAEPVGPSGLPPRATHSPTHPKRRRR